MQKENSVWGEVAKFSMCTGMVFLGLVESNSREGLMFDEITVDD